MKISLILNFPHGTRYIKKNGERKNLEIDDIFKVLDSVSKVKDFKCKFSDYYTYEIETRIDELPIKKFKEDLKDGFWRVFNLVVSVSVPKVEFNQRETKSYKIALMINKVEGKDGKEN